jgi:sulfate transport system ATP-binding protein
LRELHDRMGITSVFVTHDQEEALEMADRVVVMDHGVIEQVAPPQEIYDHPASAFVHDFVGESNRLPIEVSGQQVLFNRRPIPVPVAPAFEGQGDLFFRPHHVRLTQEGEQGLAITVAQVRRFGAETRIIGVLPGLEPPLEIALHNGDVPEPGQSISLSLLHASLYPASDRAGLAITPDHNMT